MKTAIYIEDGTLQLVITPETEFEKSALKAFEDKAVDATIFAGAFYDCRGGWVRQSQVYPSAYNSKGTEDRSLILRVKPEGGAL